MDEPIHIALTFDDGFWAPAYATMRSVCLASRKRSQLVFHLLHKGLTAAHRTKVHAINVEFGAHLVDYPLDRNPVFAEITRGFTFRYRFNDMVLARLIFDRLLPKSVKRLVYIDCDVMVRAPIEDLWASNLDGLPLGGVLDPQRHRIMLGREFRAKTDLFDYADSYLNGGVLLIDLRQWAEADLVGKTEEFRQRGLLDRLFYDQDILNLVFKGRFKPLDFRWNLGNPRPAHEALEPFLVHYSGDRKPWNPFSGTAFAQLYRHVMTNEVYYQYLRERAKRLAFKPFRRLMRAPAP